MVEKLTLAQRAFEKLEEMIVNLHLKPGQVYSEKELDIPKPTPIKVLRYFEEIVV